MTGQATGETAPGREALVTIGGDGTFALGPGPDGRPVVAEQARLHALTRLRALLGDDVEEQIATRLQLPAALGTEAADHLLPASLSLLAGTSGDLASFGWRLGAGAGRAWHRARELRARTIEDAQIALIGYEGPLQTTALGPVTLGAATFLPSGERSLADRGALRDLPHLAAEGIASQLAALAQRVPGAAPHVLVREDAAALVAGGRVSTASGYGRHEPIPAPELGARWQDLLGALGEASGITPQQATLALPARADLLTAARSAGWRRLAIPLAGTKGIDSPAGRELWEALAEARETGIALELLVDPVRIERELDALAETWTRLGYGARDLAGLTLLAHPRSRAGGRSAEAASRSADPAAEPTRDSLLTEEALERVLRAAPAWVERVQD